MKFRPCIDLHQGKVKQIVGSTLREDGEAKTNFETDARSSYFAELYKQAGMLGGHVIMLGPGNEDAALEALQAYPGGLQVGGGINPSNAMKYLEAGASHVIVTSYVFKDGAIDFERLKQLVEVVSKERLVLDLSCKKRTADGPFYVVTDRWEKFTDFELNEANLRLLAGYCSEFLVHAVDVEGKKQGMIEDLVKMLGEWSPIPVTYAGGARNIEDLNLANELGNGQVDITIGSALDIFGGELSWDAVVAWHKAHNPVEEEEETGEPEQFDEAAIDELCEFIRANSRTKSGGMTISAIRKGFIPQGGSVEDLIAESIAVGRLVKKRGLIKVEDGAFGI
jgi:phosphoribosylformimino-5-aminoimidazole carboxamide ribotide isomerase